MIVIGSNTSDNGKSHFTEDVSHFMELRQNRQLALLKRSAKKKEALFLIFGKKTCSHISKMCSNLLKVDSQMELKYFYL